MTKEKPQLIYLFVGEVNRCIHNQGLCFGNDYKVTYDIGKKHLNIYECAKNRKSIYSDNISSIDIIVGRNGCGKSTVLDLLGLPKQDRVEEFPINLNKSIKDEKKCTWFALYHLCDDSFAIEGYQCKMIDFLASFSYLQPLYSVGFRYDFAKQETVGKIDILQDYYVNEINKGNLANHSLFYLFYQIEPAVSWYSPAHRSIAFDMGSDYLFQRQYVGRAGYREVTQYLYDSIHSEDLARTISSVHGAHISIEINHRDKHFLSSNPMEDSLSNDREGENVASTYIYDGKEVLLKSFQAKYRYNINYTYAQSMVIMYLEELICAMIEDGIDNFVEKYDPEQANIYGYRYRRRYLLKRFKKIMENRDNLTDYYLAKNICKGLEQIPKEFFKNGDKADIGIKNMSDNFLIPLMLELDNNSFEEDHLINHRYYVKVKFSGLSSGEAHFLDLYASLHWGINNSMMEAGKQCILLLDEPDARFHPEWSRQFIENLVKLLKSKEFSKYSYQIIITTHSPLMLSDVSQENIHCFKKNENGQVYISTTSYGFMSNITDILMDSFFTESIFGSFSESYVNDIITRINKYENTNSYDIPPDYIDDIKRDVGVIQEEIIRESLFRRIHRLERRIEEVRYDKNKYY